ncbi:MAG TPA: hypothetical protein VGM33_13580 [Baekduia sp.]|jgi:hypothetical protein
MHHHRLVLNGPSPALQRLVDDLRRAGATVLTREGPPRMVWSTDDPRLVERVAVHHADVAVGVERFEALGTEVVRLVVRGDETTVLDRRHVLPDAEDDGPKAWRRELGDEGLQLDPELLRRAAQDVERCAGDLRPGDRADALDAGLTLGRAFGALCEGTDRERAHAEALAAVARLAAAALTVSATRVAGTGTGAGPPAVAAVERSWILTRALARAGGEALWDRPPDAVWADWLGHLMAVTSDALLACAESVDGPDTTVAAVHREHFATPDEQRASAVDALIAMCLQTLVLFDEVIR